MITSCTHETRSENSIVVSLIELNEFSGQSLQRFETFWLGNDNPNTEMYLAILEINNLCSYKFLSLFGEKLYAGPDFREAMAKRI